jgi:hypothetical protein
MLLIHDEAPAIARLAFFRGRCKHLTALSGLRELVGDCDRDQKRLELTGPDGGPIDLIESRRRADKAIDEMTTSGQLSRKFEIGVCYGVREPCGSIEMRRQ